MKKNKHIVAKAALVTYFIVMSLVVSLEVLALKKTKHDKLLEIEKSTYALQYYLSEDLHNGNLNPEVAEFYIEELEKISTVLEMEYENCDEVD